MIDVGSHVKRKSGKGGIGIVQGVGPYRARVQWAGNGKSTDILVSSLKEIDMDIDSIPILDGESVTTIADVVHAWQIKQGPPMRRPNVAITAFKVCIAGKWYDRVKSEGKAG